MTIEEALKKENNFTLLRLLLALSVVVSHAIGLGRTHVQGLEYASHLEPLVESTGLSLGGHVVFMFFAVSGFLVSMSLERRSLRDYILARILRIYPALIFIVIVLGLIAGPLFTSVSLVDYFHSRELRQFLIKTILQFKSATTLPGLFKVPIGTVWTLRWEIILYTVLLTLAICRLFRPRVILGIFTVCICAMVYMAWWNMDGKIIMVTRLFSAFFFGSFFYHYRNQLRLDWRIMLALPLVYVARDTFLLIPLILLFECYFVLLFALKPPRVINIKQDISYGIYLSGHFPLKVFLLLYPTASPVLMSVYGVCIATLYGLCSWTLVEERALALKQRLLHR